MTELDVRDVGLRHATEADGLNIYHPLIVVDEVLQDVVRRELDSLQLGRKLAEVKEDRRVLKYNFLCVFFEQDGVDLFLLLLLLLL